MSGADFARFGRIALARGGDSAEREISLRSGRAVAAALARLGLEFIELDGAPAVVEAALGGEIDTVFNLLHGRGGEDGCLQGALSLYPVAITGSGLLGSALAMDKLASKKIWHGDGLPTPPWRVATDPGMAGEIEASLGLPAFVKPAREGSSVGMTRVERPGALGAAIERALHHDDMVLVERLIEGGEYTASILDGQPLPLIRIVTAREFYDYDAKYQSGDTEYHCPCGLDQAREREVQRLALDAFKALGCSGWGRVDLMLDSTGQPWLLEANTVPGMTDQSLVPKAAQAAGINFDALVARILATARRLT
ncbi:MAG: D-alanine--D-alanine ligase [Wenzhouxiangellaceae bacterium]